MANPQVEDGFTKLANEIMEALARTRIPGEARQVLDVILRRTYGWNKKQDCISISQFHEATGIKKPSIVRAIKTLLAIKLIVVSEKAKGKTQEYEFNKDYESWEPLAKKLTFTKKLTPVSEKAKNRLQKSYIQKKKETTKETYLPFFESFWINYPSRNGKKLEKDTTLELFCALKPCEALLCIHAAKNYADSAMVQEGIGIRDPKRFLLSGRGKNKAEFWREWTEAEVKEPPQQDTTAGATEEPRKPAEPHWYYGVDGVLKEYGTDRVITEEEKAERAARRKAEKENPVLELVHGMCGEDGAR